MITWIIHIIIISSLAFLVFRKLKTSLPTWMFWIGLVMKISAGFVLGWIFYEYYGEGDTISFFEMAKSFDDFATEEPRTQFFIRILTLLVYLSGGSYWITSAWLSFISFTAAWYATSQFSKAFPSIKVLTASCFLIIPSIVFWSSGILKDTLAFAAMMVLIAAILKWYKRINITVYDFIIAVISGYLLFHLKHYLIITCLIFGGLLVSVSLIKKVKSRWKWIIAAMVLALSLISTQFVHPYLKVEKLSWTIYETNRTILEKSDLEGQLDIEIKDASILAVIKEVPKALHAGLFRPSIYDKTPIWGWLHRIENFILTILIIMSVSLYFKRNPPVDTPLFVSALCCILLLAIMLPLATPNFGTLVRYKNAYMPYLFLICSILPYHYLSSKTKE
ncbi:Predicted membrane protein [Ekhidna lutea]|uniref:Predicted membrane protein n=1 Tax=Ekhidna lutea TaxID=447679 RepID=A0A239JZR0_EKHLU|nr:DUF2142 domain-containing protein [Ekhidna lutea]SNT10903.1 Predicted membrane protein [Ekhidna lutea]